MSVQNISEEYEYYDEESVDNIVLSLGILDEEEDEGKSVQVCISFMVNSRSPITVLNFPYKFAKKNYIVTVQLKLNDFPVLGEETIFFEVYESERLLELVNFRLHIF